MSSATARRKPAARLPRPAARYRTGQVPKGAGELVSDSDEEEEAEVGEEEGDVPIEDVEEEDGLEVRKDAVKAATRGINVTLRDVNISKEGKVTVAGRAEVGKTAVELGTPSTYSYVDAPFDIHAEEEEEEEEEEEAAQEEEEVCAFNFGVLEP